CGWSKICRRKVGIVLRAARRTGLATAPQVIGPCRQSKVRVPIGELMVRKQSPFAMRVRLRCADGLAVGSDRDRRIRRRRPGKYRPSIGADARDVEARLKL